MKVCDMCSLPKSLCECDEPENFFDVDMPMGDPDDEDYCDF